MNHNRNFRNMNILVLLQAAAKSIHGTIGKSSLSISNLIGPLEQVSLDNHPIKGLYYVVFGIPQVK